MAEDTKKPSRWWEFYFVRYFVGTVIGFAIVVFLLFEPTSPFHGSNFLDTATIKDLTAANILLLSGVGLAFCYISSAPILVFHALRSAYVKRTISNMIELKIALRIANRFLSKRKVSTWVRLENNMRSTQSI